MSIQLRVEFSGLCFFVQDPRVDAAGNPATDPAGKPVIDRVAVLMPDCRKQTNPVPFHDDKTPAEPHTGYIRINLADLAASPATLPAGDAKRGPRYELVHRFDRQVLQVGDGGPADPVKIDLAYPDLEEFAPSLEFIDGLYTPDPPKALLMRMFLGGGELVAKETSQAWKLHGHFRSTRSDFKSRFASFATWTRVFDGDSLTLRITDFKGAEEASFELRPRRKNGAVLLKVANLCAHNPLEWNDMELRQVFGKDEDFKWVYRLLKPKDGSSYAQVLGGKEFPTPVRTGPRQETGSDDCIGATAVARIP